MPVAGAHLVGERRELRAHDVRIERLVAARGRTPAETASGSSLPTITLQSVTVSGPPRRYAAGPGIRARGLGPDAKARAVERADRAAARRHRVDAHHRRAQPHAGDFGDEGALVLAGPVRDVGRRAAHVEADDPVEAREPRHFDRADDAARRAGQDRVLALEQVRVGEPAARLHELQSRRSPLPARAAGQLALDLRRRSGAGSATGTRRRPSCRRARRASSAGSPRATPRPARSRCARARSRERALVLRDSDSRASARSPPRGCRRRTPRASARSRRRDVERAARPRRARRCARRPR